MTRSQSAGFAQFFPAASQAAVDRATERRKARSKAHDSTASPLPNTVGAGDASQTQSPSGDGPPNHRPQPPVDDHASPSGDALQLQGSASSHASTGSSVFSASAPPPAHTNNGTSHPSGASFTPLTTIDSPSHLSFSAQPKPNVLAAPSPDHTALVGSAPPLNGSLATSTAHTTRIQARDPGPSRKGLKCIFDPNTDRSSTKDRKNAKPIFQEFGRDDDDAPPRDPRLDENGGHISYINTDFHLPKARLRQAPYNLRPYPFDPKTSLGPGPPTQILVVGFNPLINFARVSHVFSSFGDVAESSNKMHPETGSYLGFATFRYRDTHIARSKNYGLKATDAARRAVREMHGHKLEAHVIRVEFDPEGKKSRRMLEDILRKEREVAEAEAIAATAHLSANKSVPTGPRGVATGLVAGPPPLAPKGPAAHRQATFAAPDAVIKAPMQPRQYPTVEEQLVAPLIAELPYIFVSREFVPVMPTTIPHMKRRLKSYRLEDIRLDRTGYYILFDNSPNGCLEAQRCHRSASGTELFNYKFIMQLHLPVGSDTNINTKESADVPSARTRRSPSPERRRHVEVKVREDRDRRRREEENDLEEEKRQRAKNFDPVLAACEVVRKELIEHLIKHIRTRVAAPALTAHLHPTNQVQNRRKAGLEDLVDVFAPNLGGQSPRVGTPNSSTDPIERRTGRLEVAALPRIRKVKGSRKALQQNYTFADPFGRKRPAPKSAFRSLHYRLQSPDSDADSDDEADVRASVARETEEPESRPRSRMSTDDEFSRDDLASWGPGEDDSMTEASFAASGLPSKKRKSEPECLSVAKRQKKSAEELFGIDSDQVETEPPLRELEATLEVDLAGDNERSISRSETPTLSAGKALLKQKSKKKSKKQIFEEREAAKKQHEADKPRVEEILPDELIQEDVKEEEVPPSPPKPATATIDLELFSYDVESSLAMPDDFSFGLEALRGLNMTETDLPDLARLRKKFGVADLGNVKQWLWNWTQIRELNSADPDNGRTGGIDGYYVSNSTGCARTEGVKKILNSEKSKYLPHHIKVLKAREAREAKVKKDGKDSVIPTPPAPAKGNSRANRASNRRHATLLQDELKTSTDPDVFKFNQLKKRKKPVKFARSAIHNWGLYTEENINKDDMIIEYVGEQVRQQISEIREKKYLKQGMGSSYLFRIDENTVIDATKKGGIARFINHSCMPNCTAKIIKVDGSKRIVIYALRDIARNEELTYDYKFEREIGSLDRIPCLCGTALCKGFLN